MEGDETREKGVLCRRNKKACINYTKECFRVPKKSLSVSDTASLFKVMLGDFTQFLYIYTTCLIDKKVFLEDSSGACWTVRVCMKRRSLAFGQGWYRFVLDHSIDAGEFVVFRKVGQSMFSVQIFSISGCERLSFYETKKRRGNKRKRMQTVVPNARRCRETKNGRIPTIQEVTRREERRARRTNAIIRRLIMEDIENEDLLVKDELPIITPIATMPSEVLFLFVLHKMLKS
ncbi:B3 domain-containing protein [Carex littledalei]|uniref:B3 domain-containing protein n=1 Tax=Carex littledalei TaxID=544730 RepID=A0A833VNG2_9POAL|nr:B3 domain-containing protein [Carex littledalei]